MSVGGLAPEPTITNIEMTDITYVSDEPIAYNTAVVTVEITETISDQFSTTSWFNLYTGASYGAVLGATGAALAATMGLGIYTGGEEASTPESYGGIATGASAFGDDAFNITKYLTLRVVASTYEEWTNYFIDNGVAETFQSAQGLLDIVPALYTKIIISDTSLLDYLSETEQDDITQYYYTALSNGEPSEYHIPFEVTIELPDGDHNPGQTGHLQFYAYVFWDMDKIAEDYGIDIDTFDWGTVAGPSSTVNFIPDGDTGVVDYSLMQVCSERDEVLAEFEEYLSTVAEISEIEYAESIIGDECDPTDYEITVSGLWYMNIRNIVMKNSQFGSVFAPTTSEDASFFQELINNYIVFDEAVLYRAYVPLYDASGKSEDTGTGGTLVGASTDTEEAPERIAEYDFSTDIESGILTDAEGFIQSVTFNIIPSPSSEVAIMYFDDASVFDLSYLDVSGGGFDDDIVRDIYYGIEIAIQDNLADYFLTVLDQLADARDWIEKYQRHALLPCNYNTVNDRFNDFFADYLAVPYSSYENFLSELNGVVAKFVLASKILKCITITEAPDAHTLILSKLHPDTARPSSINQAIKAYEDLEYILMTELGFERTEARGSSAPSSYRYVYNSADATSTIHIKKGWSTPYAASAENISDYFACDPEEAASFGGGGAGLGAGGSAGTRGGEGGLIGGGSTTHVNPGDWKSAGMEWQAPGQGGTQHPGGPSRPGGPLRPGPKAPWTPEEDDPWDEYPA